MSDINNIKIHPLTMKPNEAWDQITKKSWIPKLCPCLAESTQPQVIDCDNKEPNTLVSENYIRIVCISDTHSQIETSQIVIPDGDIIIHAGDFSNIGLLQEVRKFNNWIGSLPHTHKIVIAGNHELSFDADTICQVLPDDSDDTITVEKMKKELKNCTYLQDSGVELYGIKIYGSPWQPEFGNWGFNLQRGVACLEKWNKIPNDTDILITHGPPLGYGDLCKNELRAGCVELLNTVRLRVQPKYHIYGHIHEGYGVRSDGQTTFIINASICNVNGLPNNKPIVFDIEIPEGYSKNKI